MTNPLADLIAQPGLDYQARRAAMDVYKLQRSLEKEGIDPGPIEPRKSTFSQVLDWIATPQQAVGGIIDSAVQGKLGEEGIGGAMYRGAADDITGSQILKHANWGTPAGRAVAGFAMDVLTDPLTYLSFGTSRFAQAGGKALTAAGLAEKTIISEALRSGMDDATRAATALDTEKLIDVAYQGLFEWKSAAKNLAKAKESGSQAALEAATFAANQAHSKFKPLIEASPEIAAKLGNENELAAFIDKSFVKPGFRVGIDLPFAGHLFANETQAAKLTKLATDTGPVADIFAPAEKVDGIIKKTFKGVANQLSEIGKTGRVKIFEWEASDNLVDSISQISETVNNKLLNFTNKVGEAVLSTPGIGKPLEMVTNATKEFYKGAQRTFLRTFVIGPKAKIAENEYRNALAEIDDVSMEHMVNDLGNFIFQKGPDGRVVRDAKGAILKNATGTKALNDAALRMDAAMRGSLKEFNDYIELASPDYKRQLLGAMERYAKGVANETDDAILGMAKQSGFDNIAQRRIDEILADPSLAGEERDAFIALKKSFDTMHDEDTIAGVGTSYLNGYIPHLYHNPKVSSVKVGKSGTGFDFSKTRKFTTLQEALDAGYVGQTNAPLLYFTRKRASLSAQARAAYVKRMTLENGLPKQVVENLYREAATDPAGPAAEMLRKFRIPTPQKVTDPEVLADAAKIQMFGKRESLQRELAKPNLPPTLQKQLQQELDDVQTVIHNKAWEGNFRPLDGNAPMLGEKASYRTVDGEDYWVPDHIARAMDENLAARDWLKNKLSDSPFGQALLRLNDSSMSFLKKSATIPFPAFHIQNVIGDGLLRFFDGGIAAHDPGLLARLDDILGGRAGIRTAGGAIIDGATFKRALRAGGIKASATDLFELVDGAAKLDVDSWVKGKNSVLANARTPGSRMLAFKQATEKVRGLFEQNFRAAHVLHRLERGDTLPDALRHTQEIMINYRDMTPVEQSLARRFFMFYGWMKGSTKLTLRSLITQPSDLLAQMKAARSTAEFFASNQEVQDLDTHDYDLLKTATQQEQVAFMLGKTKSGDTLVARNFGLPMNTLLASFSLQSPRKASVGEIVDAVGDSAHRTAQKLFAAGNPWIVAAAEQISGKNLYFDKPLNAEFLRKVPALKEAGKQLAQFTGGAIPETVFNGLDDFTKQYLGGVPDGKGRYIVNSGRLWSLVTFIPGIERALSLGNLAINPEVPASMKALQAFSGARIEEQNVEMQALGQIRSQLQEVAESRSLSARRKARRHGWE